MHIAVIASLKQGLEHFISRELGVLADEGCEISLFPTKYKAGGLYEPRQDWKFYPWSMLMVLALQPWFLLRHPLLYVRLLREAIALRGLVDFLLAWNFSRFMSDTDVIYATFGDHKLFVGYFCKRITGKPLAVTIHAYELYTNPNPVFFSHALAACDQILTVTEFNRELLVKKFGIAAPRIEVVRISVDVEDYRPQKKFVVLIVGNFAERKGHEILFRAIKQLGESNMEVWVVGDRGPEGDTLDVPRIANEFGVADRVAFFGPLRGNALKAVYRNCDVFCLPCRTDGKGVAEGFPTVLAEAMAFGKPVISTRHVEIPRVVREIVVDENDVDGLCDALRQVYQSSELRDRLGSENRRIAERTFSTRNAMQTARILSRVAQLNSSAAVHEFPLKSSLTES